LPYLLANFSIAVLIATTYTLRSIMSGNLVPMPEQSSKSGNEDRGVSLIDNSDQEPAEKPQDTTSTGDHTAVAPRQDQAKPSLFDLVRNTKDFNEHKRAIQQAISDAIVNSEIGHQYNVLFLYDDYDSINRFTANEIYSAVTSATHDRNKALLLIVFSNGGSIEPAYLISKSCKKTSSKFVVAVPRFAKSAATLIALGADEIHMGMISELGPIDPQVGQYPALGLGFALDYIAGVCKKYPQTATMFSEYLSAKLDLRDLGYLERVSKSAVQYAERLLANRELPEDQTPASVAHKFVYEYKDHGFVIDVDEATETLGRALVRTGTPEYHLANEIHDLLSPLELAYNFFHQKRFKILGRHETGMYIWDLKN